MKTVAIIGQKGGTGKTTLAQILAVGAARDGAVTAIVDLDPQVSACQWSDLRQNDSPIVLDAQPARLPKVLETARAQGVRLVVIDTAGRAEQAALAAAKAADVVLIPLQPSVADLTTVEGALNIVKLAGSSRYVAVLTRVKAKGTRHQGSRMINQGLSGMAGFKTMRPHRRPEERPLPNRSTSLPSGLGYRSDLMREPWTRHTETADWLAAQGIEVCPVVIGDRVTYQDAYAAGQTPPEFDPRSKAATECEELNRFVGQLLNELTHEGVKHG